MSTRPAKPASAAPTVPAVEDLPAGQRARRARIIAAALDLLGDADYERIQIRMVAERAGVALGTLYRYFPSKEHLFAAALAEWGAGFGPRQSGRTAARPPEPPARLKRALRDAVTAFERNPQLFSLVNLLSSVDDPAVAETMWRYSEQTRAAFMGVLDGIDPDTAETIVWMSLALLSSVLQSWVTGRISIEEARRRLDQGVDVIFTVPPTV
ncbi:TetR/AcrR family transcriptional regulator [Rhabdothermincola salaria]|uniref:TetR/AcrR family transcriptional regulator n=1 Tax=Rhabdothermincola salaria TaxID=2903142 RepID=UPI001E59997C|nr:TetR/AcrR family transcriptional regulator [Rhabdothermincola salaria]MCD9624301.1 TetR family transcriptional regulator [Rhabdothermincola salaria]